MQKTCQGPNRNSVASERAKVLSSPVCDGCKGVCATPCLAHVVADQHISGLCAQKQPLLSLNAMNCTSLCIPRPDLGL